MLHEAGLWAVSPESLGTLNVHKDDFTGESVRGRLSVGSSGDSPPSIGVTGIPKNIPSIAFPNLWRWSELHQQLLGRMWGQLGWQEKPMGWQRGECMDNTSQTSG